MTELIAGKFTSVNAPSKERIETVCSIRFPTWDTMNDKTKNTYRRQAAFWLEAADRDRSS